MAKKSQIPEETLKSIFEEASEFGNVSEICRKYRISRTKYYYYKSKLFQDTHVEEFLKNPTRKANSLPEDAEEKIIKLVREYPQIGCAEYSKLYLHRWKVSISKVTIQKVLNENQLGRKKNRLELVIQELIEKEIASFKKEKKNLRMYLIRLNNKHVCMIITQPFYWKMTPFRAKGFFNSNVIFKIYTQLVQPVKSDPKDVFVYNHKYLDHIVQNLLELPFWQGQNPFHFSQSNSVQKLSDLCLSLEKFKEKSFKKSPSSRKKSASHFSKSK